MEWKKNIDTNLGITIILVFAALFTIIDFYIVGSELDGYPFNDLSDEVVIEDKDTVVEDDNKGDVLLSNEEALTIGNELYEKVGKIYINHGGLVETYNSDGVNKPVYYNENSDGSFSRVDYSFFYDNKDSYPYLKLVISDVKNILSNDKFDDFCLEFSIVKYLDNYYRVDGDRGSNLLYGGTQLKVVSISKDKIVFDADAYYYINSEDALNSVPLFETESEIKSNIFELTYENETWKVNEFVMPY